MITNGIEIPDASSTKEYIPDPMGGWMYVVTTAVSVEQVNLKDFEAHVDSIKSQIASLEASLAQIEPASISFQQAVSAVPQSFEVAPRTINAETASSSPAL